MSSQTKRGFTLMELLIVVIIIGVLAAIAVPQYQKAVLKSRFAALMPIAKTLAEGNEVYYMEHGNYSESPTDLPIPGKANDTTYADGTSILLDNGIEDGLSFVLVSKDSVPNARYVVYQKHSVNFADTTMCEAADDRANELCQVLGGELVETSGNSTGDTTKEWKVYLLSGMYRATDHFGENHDDEEEEEDQTPPCELPTDEELATLQSNIRAANSDNANVTVSVECVNGRAKYVWSGGRKYVTGFMIYSDSAYQRVGTFHDGCTSTASYGCIGTYTSGSCYSTRTSGCTLSEFTGPSAICAAGASNVCTDNTFSGSRSACRALATNGCTNSEFSGSGSNCQAWERSNYSCTNNTFSGEDSVCRGYGSGACANNTFSGERSHCTATDVFSACSGSKFLPGAYCETSRYGTGCEGTEYPVVEVNNGDGTTTQTRGCCYSTKSCPAGTPKCDPNTKKWDGTYW